MSFCETTIERVDAATVVHLAGELDSSNTEAVARALRTAFSSGERGVILDLSALTFLDSAGIHLLFRVDRWLKEEGAGLVLVLPQDSFTRNLVGLARLPDAIAVSPSVDTALALR